LLHKNPIVSSKTSAMREAITNGLNGILAPVKNLVEFKNDFKRLKNKKLRDKYGRNGYNIVKTKFTLKKMFEGTANVNWCAFGYKK